MHTKTAEKTDKLSIVSRRSKIKVLIPSKLSSLILCSIIINPPKISGILDIVILMRLKESSFKANLKGLKPES